MNQDLSAIIEKHKLSPRQSFIAYLQMMRVFADHWNDPLVVMQTYFLDPKESTEYLFETLWQAWTELSDDPCEVFAVIPESEYYRIIKDNDYFTCYRVPKVLLPEVREEWFVEFYVLPDEGAEWVLICTDGYEHFPSCIVRRKSE
jgi:hypothetical protein